MKTTLVLLVLCLLSTVVRAAPEVRICDDSSEWPPYSYFPRVAGKVESKELTGAMIELIEEIFQRLELAYTITPIPWNRCLYEVAHFGQRQRYEIAIEGTLNEKRLRAYYVTSYVYKTTGGYWYSTEKYPQGPVVQSPQDLKQYKLCGIRSYNYTGYEIETQGLSRTPPDYRTAMTLVSQGRCDLFLSNIPTVMGKVRLGELDIPKDVVGKKVPHLPSGTFHIFVAKSSPRAFELLTKINQALHKLNFEGITDAIFRKYLPTCGRHC